MIRKLLIIFASALVLAILSLGGAWVAGGHEVIARINHGDSIVWNPIFDEGDKDQQGPRATRQIEWDGADPLVVEVPVDLRFTRGDRYGMIVRGPAKALQALRFEKGRLYLDQNGPRHIKGLEVEMTGPRLATLTLNSAGNIDLRNLDQPALRIEAEGTANVEASGTVNALEIVAEGVGNLDFTALKARDARLKVEGVGNVDINATGVVDVDVSGIGNVTLHSRPKALTTRSDGIGSIEKAY